MYAGVIVSLISSGYFDAYKETTTQLNEFFNEVIIVLTLYTIMCFTNFVPDQMMQLNVGYASCLLVVVHLLINLAVMGSGHMQKVILKLKRFFYQRKSKTQQRAGVSPAQSVKTIMKIPLSI